MEQDNRGAVSTFAFTVQGRTRDQAIALADEIGNKFLSVVGGEPWLMIDDDFQRVHAQGVSPLVDDQGFMYNGRRSYAFKGPAVTSVDVQEHSGYRTQKGEHHAD